MGNTDGFDGPIPQEISGFELDELEVGVLKRSFVGFDLYMTDVVMLQIQKGLLQVGKGLQFLNHDAKVVHRNLVPEAIFVNAKVGACLIGMDTEYSQT